MMGEDEVTTTSILSKENPSAASELKLPALTPSRVITKK